MDEDSDVEIYESDLSDDAFMGDDTQPNDDEGGDDFDEDDDEAILDDEALEGALMSPSVGEEGDNAFFGSQDLGKARKSSYEVDYKSHTIASIEMLQQKEVEQIAAMFNVKVSIATRKCDSRH